ncbi:S4 domain-containing protein [Alteraurantiacibacter buctensis]|uniref:RNA-binding S4 domain-containing protein n=1 Tax=Alteraurantiacibacter buctensis TaxID=1503981 RepID=A0A844YXR5_9SPHN|nr:S4 domain-containing protein [Alteraurantiacibacter buctensis]MXO70533.1 RNA-binding S4 domain-containing protein [Alteraurantiacibacter buctensis]
MRADLLLFRLRLAKSRALAQARIAEGHMRLNGQRLLARDRAVAVGDVLTLPLGPSVQVVQIVSLPERRGPPAEARSCYRVLDAGGSFAIAES